MNKALCVSNLAHGSMGLSERVARSAKTLHRDCHNVTVSIPQKMTAGKQTQTPTHSLQGHAYHTLASSFEELKLIVSDNRVKSAMNLPA